MCQNCLKCHFLNQEKSHKKDGDIKICPRVGQMDRKNTKTNVNFWTKKKVKEKDSDLKISFPVGQIDGKNRN